MKKKKIVPKWQCNCIACKHGLEYLRRQEHESILKYGWYAHIVYPDCSAPNHFNMHTHMLPEQYGHLDLQCCFPHPDPNVLMTIFHDIINDIKKGKVFLPGVDYQDYIRGGYFVRFVDRQEGGRPIMRMLVPDKKGKYDDGPFLEQLLP